ncbi:MAG: pyridoxal phosphate-dependent aminotransferase [Chlamydiia bacterium]|nr:pyridoxal phosphate-dependent aminotransferase [Chlamydiia bacterium]
MSPGMPTGYIPTHREWEEIAQVVRDADLWLLYDAAMEKILYDGRTVIHPASFPDMRERTITVGAASKELRMIGWRVGWVVAPQEIMESIGLVSISNVVCQTGISMAGAAAGLTASDNGLKEAVAVWEERRNTLLKELNGLPVIPPHGGWSMLIDAKQLGMNAKQLADTLFQQAKIAATPMTGWGEQAAQYVRFVFSSEPKERLIGIGERIKKFL